MTGKASLDLWLIWHICFDMTAFRRPIRACMGVLLHKLKAGDSGNWAELNQRMLASCWPCPSLSLSVFVYMCLVTHFRWKERLLDTKLLAVSFTHAHFRFVSHPLPLWHRPIRVGTEDISIQLMGRVGEGVTNKNSPSFLSACFSQKEKQHSNVESKPRCSCLFLWDWPHFQRPPATALHSTSKWSQICSFFRSSSLCCKYVCVCV